MSNNDEEMAHAADADGSDAAGSAANGADLQDLLHGIAAQIANNEHQQSSLLEQLRDRINVLGERTGQVREDVSEELTPAFDRLEDRLQGLAAQVSDAVEQRKEHLPSENVLAVEAPPVFQDTPPQSMPVVNSTHAGDPEQPWTLEAAEALTQAYESQAQLDPSFQDLAPQILHECCGSAICNCDDMTKNETIESSELQTSMAVAPVTPVTVEPGESVVEPAISGLDFDRAWLDERFATIALRIEDTLREMRPDNEFVALGDKFEKLEERVGSALHDVVARADTQGLTSVEVSISELSSYVEQVRSQLSRLDNVETHLEAVMDRLSDERMAQLLQNGSRSSEDIERLAVFAAESAATQIAKTVSDGSGQTEIRELQGMMSEFIADNRVGEEETAGLLDTLREAMVRVLDRVEALEQVTHDAIEARHAAPAAPAADVQTHHAMPAPAPLHASADVDGIPASAMPIASQSAGVMPQQPEPMTTAIAPPPALQLGDEFAQTELQAPPAPQAAAPMPSEPAPTLAPLGAEAPQNPPLSGGPTVVVQSTAAPEVPTPSTIEKIRLDFIKDARVAKEKAAQIAAQEAASGQSEKQSLTASLLRRRPGGSKAAAPDGSQATAGRAREDDGESGKKSLRQRLFGALVLLLVVPSAVMLYANGAATPHIEATGVAHEASGKNENLAKVPAAPSATHSSGAVAPVKPGLLHPTNYSPEHPPAGIKVQRSRPLSPAALVHMEEQQQIAYLSSRLGEAAAKASPESLSPEVASMRSDNEPGSATPGPVANSDTRKTLGLPPATVGPLSLRIAAAKGDPSAEFEVGARLAEGKGPNQDFKDAARWYQRSASKGFAQSQYRLGTLYERGLGMKKDVSRARVWYKRAAEGGNIKAMHNIAVLSAGGGSGSPDYATAAQWFRKAADRGLSDSQFNLAVLYENGLGLKRDLVQSYKYASLAAQSGDAEAIKRRQSLTKLLSEEERQKAEGFLKTWRRLPSDVLANDAQRAGSDWKTRTSAGYSG